MKFVTCRRNRIHRWLGGAILLPTLIAAASLRAGEEPDLPPDALRVAWGRYTQGTTGKSAEFWRVPYEDNYAVTLDYSHEFWDLGARFHVGVETGLAARFGDDFSGEAWNGLVLRHRGLRFGDWLRVSPGVTVGVSLVTDAIGQEARRELSRGGDATLLFYLGAEIAFSVPKYPRWELVYRLHHRSGANGTFGDMAEGHNANTLGVRWRF